MITDNAIKKIQCSIESIVMITIKHLSMNQILALNNPSEVDMPLNKWTKPNQTKPWHCNNHVAILQHSNNPIASTV